MLSSPSFIETDGSRQHKLLVPVVLQDQIPKEQLVPGGKLSHCVVFFCAVQFTITFFPLEF